MIDYSRSNHGNDWAAILADYTERIGGYKVATKSDAYLADLCGVSRGTVRQARHRHDVCSMSLREKIAAEAAQ